jgi:hypothetical protein
MSNYGSSTCNPVTRQSCNRRHCRCQTLVVIVVGFHLVPWDATASSVPFTSALAMNATWTTTVQSRC